MLIQEAIVIHKKKVIEFEEILESPQAKILILTGPPGSAKNTLIDVYCKKMENSVELTRFVDTKGQAMPDVYGEQSTFKNSSDPYPDDLENLLYFIRTKYAQAETTRPKAVMTSSFCKSKVAPTKPHTNPKPTITTDISNGQQSATKKKRILVINGLPECLKLFSSKKLELLRDFNSVLENVVLCKNNQP